MELGKFVTGDTELTHIVTKAMTHGPELERADKHRLDVVLMAAMRSYEVTLAHCASQYLDPTEYSGFGSNLSGWVGASYFSDWWENAQVNFSRALQDLVKQEMKNLPSHPSFLTHSSSAKPAG
jgi:hypothetical protein